MDVPASAVSGEGHCAEQLQQVGNTDGGDRGFVCRHSLCVVVLPVLREGRDALCLSAVPTPVHLLPAAARGGLLGEEPAFPPHVAASKAPEGLPLRPKSLTTAPQRQHLQ